MQTVFTKKIEKLPNASSHRSWKRAFLRPLLVTFNLALQPSTYNPPWVNNKTKSSPPPLFGALCLPFVFLPFGGGGGQGFPFPNFPSTMDPAVHTKVFFDEFQPRFAPKGHKKSHFGHFSGGKVFGRHGGPGRPDRKPISLSVPFVSLGGGGWSSSPGGPPLQSSCPSCG